MDIAEQWQCRADPHVSSPLLHAFSSSAVEYDAGAAAGVAILVLFTVATVTVCVWYWRRSQQKYAFDPNLPDPTIPAHRTPSARAQHTDDIPAAIEMGPSAVAAASASASASASPSGPVASVSGVKRDRSDSKESVNSTVPLTGAGGAVGRERADSHAAALTVPPSPAAAAVAAAAAGAVVVEVPPATPLGAATPAAAAPASAPVPAAAVIAVGSAADPFSGAPAS
jgi:hypothetical protein